jgi:hypothetical protein
MSEIVTVPPKFDEAELNRLREIRRKNYPDKVLAAERQLAAIDDKIRALEEEREAVRAQLMAERSAAGLGGEPWETGYRR